MIKCLPIRVFQDDSSLVMVDKWLLVVLALGARSSSTAQSLD